MGTRLDRPALAAPALASRASARKLAERAAAAAIAGAGLDPCQIDLLLNVGLYHDRNLGEPALAALIQQDVGINPDDPHRGAHGSFSFDVANGACGVLTALRIADGFLRSGVIEHAVVVASDADPGRRMARHFPFSAYGAAVHCGWSDGSAGLAGCRFVRAAGEEAQLRARVSFEGRRNRLRVEQDPAFDVTAAAWAAKAADLVLGDASLRSSEVDLVVANPLTEAFLEGLASHLGIEPERVVTVRGAGAVHTAGLLVALDAAAEQGRLAESKRVLLVSAGAGIVAGAAVMVA
jgi:3-oxoacyl-[acyl-carrier-protein] synthase III